MNFRTLVLSFSLIFGLATGNLNLAYADNERVTLEQQAGNIILHTVEKGETLFSIAKTYGITVEQIIQLNPEANKGIRVGENLMVTKPTSYKEHTIQPKETLYGVSRTYNITIEELVAANPGLGEGGFKIGGKIKIPVYGAQVRSQPVIALDAPHLSKTHTRYTVGKKETLYGISKAHDVAINQIFEANPQLQEQGLKEGMVIYLPKKQLEQKLDESFVGSNVESFFTLDDKVRIGILLPFLEENGVIDKTKIIEYYEGLLLALRDVKKQGLNAEVYTFDIGGKSNMTRLESILDTNESKSLSLIIGGVSEEQIKTISKFSRQRSIKYVVPIGALEDEVDLNPYLYQATNSHSNLYGKISDAFIHTYPTVSNNFVFVSEPEGDNNKTEFTAILKLALSRAKIPYKTVNMDFEDRSSFLSSLDSGKNNIIIPESSAELTLRRVNSLLNYAHSAKTSLFGYPEWQVYTAFRKILHERDTHVYSMFYFDSQRDLIKIFEEDYEHWYGKTLVQSYPKYAHLGYDTGLYFFTALNKFGNIFQTQLGNMVVPTMQSSIYYEKPSENGGYMNTGLYFIHYKEDMSTETKDCNRIR